MKKKINVHLLLKTAILLLLSMTIILPIQADEKDSTPFNWSNTIWQDSDSNDEKIDKDLLYPPITAYIESSLLYIRNDKPEGALDIAIISGKSGRVVWEQIVPEAATALVIIPLDTLPAGEYTLQVANEWGGYLCGSFRK